MTIRDEKRYKGNTKVIDLAQKKKFKFNVAVSWNRVEFGVSETTTTGDNNENEVNDNNNKNGDDVEGNEQEELENNNEERQLMVILGHADEENDDQNAITATVSSSYVHPLLKKLKKFREMIDNEEYKGNGKKILQDVFQAEIKMEPLDKSDVKNKSNDELDEIIEKTLNLLKRSNRNHEANRIMSNYTMAQIFLCIYKFCYHIYSKNRKNSSIIKILQLLLLKVYYFYFC